ncbi:MAG: tetratricopeptide repeat protein [Deltaproteobacteria bacterium]|nr:tetratricopeptide repeat protein [Deltaproteobacteria bacterium]
MKRVDRTRYFTWLFQAAETFYERGNFDKALKYFERLIKQHGKFLETSMKADCYAYLGDIYLFNEDFSKAVEYLNRAIGLDADFSHYYYLLGMVYQTQENWRRAIEEFQRAVKLEPKNSIYLEELGRTYVFTGNLYEGEKLLRKAWRMDVTNIGAGVELAGVLLSLGKFKDSIELVQEILAGNDSLHDGIVDYLENIRLDAERGIEEKARRRRKSKKKKTDKEK